MRAARICLALCLCAKVAQAEPTEITHGPLALVESKPDGTMRQVTLVVLVHAPAAAVRALVADVGAYPRFVPNLKKADFARGPDGVWVNSWRLELPISSFSGRDAYDIDAAPLGPIRFHSLETLAHYEWRFIPVGSVGTSGEATLLVQAGYADVLHANRFVRAFVRRQPPLKHGLALAAQYMLVSAVRDEAERRAARAAVTLPPTPASTLERLSTRGQVVVMRSAGRALAEVALVDRIYAPEARVRAVIADPGSYASFIAGVDRSVVTGQDGGDLLYERDMSLPITTWSTHYRMHLGEHAIDGFGTEGDLRGARFRWDLQARGPRETLVTYRARQPLSRGSFIARKLFEVDPSLEYGLNVAFALLELRSVRGRAEGWATK